MRTEWSGTGGPTSARPDGHALHVRCRTTIGRLEWEADRSSHRETTETADILDGMTAGLRALCRRDVWSGGKIGAGDWERCRTYRNGEPATLDEAFAVDAMIDAFVEFARAPVTVWSGETTDGHPVRYLVRNGVRITLLAASPGYGTEWTGSGVADAIEAFARWTPFVGWRDHDPERPPREDEALLLLDGDGYITHESDGFHDSEEQWGWWVSYLDGSYRWRYASEVLPEGAS